MRFYSSALLSTPKGIQKHIEQRNMVIPMRPGSRGASSRPPLYSQLYHARSRTGLIDLTSMEEESAQDDSRGRVELSRDSVERVRDGSQRVSWMNDYPSEIHVTSPRENPSGAPSGKAASFRPLQNYNNNQHSHEHNTQKTEYGWSAHDYPSVVNVTGIDDVSEMGFQSQNGDQMSLKESLPSKTPVVYAQSDHQSKISTAGLDSKTSDILSRMKAITGRLGAERLIGAENDSASHRNSLSVATGRAIVHGEDILHEDRDDLPLEVNIKRRSDPREEIIQASQSTHDKIERGDYDPGEVNVSLNPNAPLRFVQVGYEPSHLSRDDGDKDNQENDDSRDLNPSRSSQSSRSTQSVYLRALSRRLSEKWKRNGAVSKGFESLTLSAGELFTACASEQAIRFHDVKSVDCPEIIDLNDYDDSDSHFLMKTESIQTDVVGSRGEKGEMSTDVLSAKRTENQSVTQTEPVSVEPTGSDEMDQHKSSQSTESTQSKPDDSLTQEGRSENHIGDIGDDKSLDNDVFVPEADTEASNKNSQGRGRSRISRAARKRKMTGRSLQSSRERSPVKAADAQRGTDKSTSGGLSENQEPSKVECAPLDEEKGKDLSKAEQGIHFDEKFVLNALALVGENELRNQHLHKTGQRTMEAKSEERKEREELSNSPLTSDKDVIIDKSKENCEEIDVGNDRNTQPLSLNLNVSDYAATTSGSSTFEVEVEDLYVSSSNSEEEKGIRTASIGGAIQGRSSEEAEDIASVAYSNSSESDLEPEYDIYDQCVMPFIPKFLDTACAWLDGEEYGIRAQQSASSLMYKLQKKKKNVGQRKNNKKNNRSRSKTNRNSKGARSLDLREVSRFARPRRSADSYAQRSQDQGPPDRSWQTSSSPHTKARSVTRPEVVSEGDDKGRNSNYEALRFTFSESKSSGESSKRSPAAISETENRKLSPTVDKQPVSPTTERKNIDGMCRVNRANVLIDSLGSQESPFRKKLQERLESIKSRDATADGERSMEQNKVATPKTPPKQLISHSPMRVPRDPPSLTPQAPQPNDSMCSPKQAEIVKISPKTEHNVCERINPGNSRSSRPSSFFSGASSSPIHDKRMATFRDGRLIVTDAVPRSQTVATHQNGTFTELSQSVPQGDSSERPFDESTQKAETDSDQSFADKLRERNSQRISNAAGGPETLQDIRARRRLIEQKQCASSSRIRRSSQEHESQSAMYEQSEQSSKSIQENYSSPRTSRQHTVTTRGRQSPSRSPSKRSERSTNSKLSREKDNTSKIESDGAIDVIDAELVASMAVMDEYERSAALELVEKLRRRASTLQRRHKVRNRRLHSMDEYHQQRTRFSESSNDDHFASVTRQEWEGNGFSISAA